MPRIALRVGTIAERVAGACVSLAVAGLQFGCGAGSAAATPASASAVAADVAPAQESKDVPQQPGQKTATKTADDKHLPPDPFPRKTAAPELPKDAEWLNTSGPITLKSLRGKIVILDFWTYCCINCMHVLPDLKKLEEKYPSELAVIGVHSAKFDGERDTENIREAILRYEISHPVVNDADMRIWRTFDVHSWPTLWMIDPEGNAVGYISGESVFDTLDRAITVLVKFHKAKGTLNLTPLHFDLERGRVADAPLRFPGKVLADAASDRLFISDSNHNRIVIATLAGKLIATVGAGDAGLKDGGYDEAKFFRPQGMALDGDALFVADTENHALRRIDLKSRKVSTIAGNGDQGASRSHRPQKSKDATLNSPWDLCFADGRLFIAMAGPHQIWVWDAADDTVRAFAGSGREEIQDGPLDEAAFAQPSGITAHGKWMFVADSEGSSIRALSSDDDAEVNTIVGTSLLPFGRLFTFGDRDGTGLARAVQKKANDLKEVDDDSELKTTGPLLQHPLGVAYHDGKVFVADTYNNKIKVVDPVQQTSRVFLGTGKAGKSDDPPQFDEPGGLSIADGKLYIADTNNHLIRVADLATGSVTTLEIAGLAAPRRLRVEARPSFPNARKVVLDEQSLPLASKAELRVKVQLPDGYELNPLAPMSYLVETPEPAGAVRSEIAGKLQRVAKPSDTLTIPITTGNAEGAGKLRVSLTYYRCREGAGGVCEVKSVIWEVPIRIAKTGARAVIDLVAEDAEALVPASR